MTGIYLLVWGAALAAIVFAARRAFWQARYRDALDEPTQELDIVDAAFEDYRMVHGKTVAELLDEAGERADRLAAELESETARFEAIQFELIRRSFRRDLRFRFATWAALRDARRTRQT